MWMVQRRHGARFTLDGKSYTLAQNNGPNSLHGGPTNFGRRLWSAKVVRGKDGDALELRYVSKDGEEGFPGTLTATVVYSLREDGGLVIDYTATTDAPTVVNLSSHPYWNLAGLDAPVEVHGLEVEARHYLPIDDTGVPEGEPEPVGGTPYDLTVPMPVAPGFDHCWLLDGPHGCLRPAAVLEGGGLRLELATDQPALQVYTGGGRWNGVALEPQHAPDSPNHPEWPSTVLRPGEEYRWTSVVRIRSV